jgi:acetyl-CoA carboxylase biotin carboxylase subunit
LLPTDVADDVASNPVFQKVLIANRSEIAVRIARTLREMEIRSVAVYSDADEGALHTQVADEAHHIGPAPPIQSYLNQERIIEVAKRVGAEAIHPGYGFLSENASFARNCEDAGITFIGPPADAIDTMGSKIKARQAATVAGVPIVPGTNEALQDEGEIARLANDFGFPVAIKAAAGGGGYGMRVVSSPAEIPDALAGVQRDAQRAFGDTTVYVEKFFDPAPRHIEIQILGDRHGRTLHLGERECSLQRRFQKVIEETPSPAVSGGLRQQMGQAAVALAKEIGYSSAGTIECLVDRQGQFYFLEMNTRLQVEHPITELVTGVDLVREMILVAAGYPLSITDEVRFQGHAIEARIYAEDPERNFMPSPGEITRVHAPSLPNVRVDTSMTSDMKVSVYYDPLIAKVCGWGVDRADAIETLLHALNEFEIEGIKTNLGFLKQLIGTDDFQKGQVHTRYIDEHLSLLTNRS